MQCRPALGAGRPDPGAGVPVRLDRGRRAPGGRGGPAGVGPGPGRAGSMLLPVPRSNESAAPPGPATAAAGIVTLPVSESR
jgi:hypothetical protein